MRVEAVLAGSVRREGEQIRVVARLVEVVETSLGREFDDPPSVSLASGDELRAMAPEGTFVGEDLWDVLVGLGLVDEGDSRTDADQYASGICNRQGFCDAEQKRAKPRQEQCG